MTYHNVQNNNNKTYISLTALIIGLPAHAEQSANSVAQSPLYIATTVFLLCSLLVMGWSVLSLRRSQQSERHSKQLLQSTLEGSGDILWDWNLVSGEVMRINDERHSQTSHIISKQIPPNRALIHPQDLPAVENALRAHLAQKTAFFEASYRLQDEQGQWRWVLDRGKVVEKNAQLQPVRMTGTVKDIHDIKTTEQRLNLFATCVENLSDALVIYDHKFKLIDTNPAFTALFGLSRQYHFGHDFAIPGKNQQRNEAIRQSILGTHHFLNEVNVTTVTGQPLCMELSVDKVRDESGQIEYYILVYSDLSERKNAEQALNDLSNQDTLTRLPNRNQFFADLDVLMEKDNQHAVLVMDLDNIKKINDSLGHQLGDKLLVKLAQRLNERKRPQDSFYRLGGDEFALIMRGTNDIHSITALSKDFLKTIATPFRMMGHELAITASIGIVLSPEDGRTPQALLKNADTAMYHAKQQGNRYLFFNDAMNHQAVKRLQIENLMRFGLKKDHFEVFYQPKMDIKTGEIAGMEALVRFITPKKGMISPGLFIPIAEETGQIIDIGEVVLRKACADVKRWRELGLFNQRVAVNLSAKQFALADLTTRIERILHQSQLPASALELEITEGTVMDNPEHAIAVMHALVDKGMHLAMDDFGTGYSSLAYLKRFPLHTLKIDRAFIIDMENERGKNMVDSIITMAQNLSLHVVAEGVEEVEQLQQLRDLGCETMQGYYYSKPLSSEQFEAFLRQQRKESNDTQHLSLVR
ncbi:putative bifunctional diguanylate cyclase/phosphodiesterase [Pseudoalteromonas sp. SSDWG2]|uniref:putative bifunctional diguanylate cyclase/phosphodiesterase n=1 Tax=Pseudoalteromonas sp. SSDWG2 TaxID=3139391 RepID=UPI003BAA27B9